jgi:GNAT superfamily N-acetyltransferase
VELVAGSAALARRLEAADARNAAVAAHTAIETGGGIAAFAGAGSPLTHAIGVGMNGPVSAADLDMIEQFYFSRESNVNIDLCPAADPSLAELFGRRGYRIVEFNNVLVRRVYGPIDFVDPRIERVGEDCADEWSQMLAEGFFEHDPSAAEVQIGRELFVMSGAVAYWARIEDAAAAGGAMTVDAGVATLFGDATLRQFRGRGLQSALIVARLARAYEQGAELATAATIPCGVSQRNYERCGFRVAYTKLNMQSDWAG